MQTLLPFYYIVTTEIANEYNSPDFNFQSATGVKVKKDIIKAAQIDFRL